MNWYVDSAATGANNGTSWADAWPSFGSITTAIAPGDTIYVSGGASGGTKTYTGGCIIPKAGTSGNPISFRIDAANTSHNGTVIVDMAASSPMSGYVFGMKSHIHWNGNVGGERHFIFRNAYNPAKRTEAIFFRSTSALTGVKMTYLRFENCNLGIRFSGSINTDIEVAHCVGDDIRGDAAIHINGSAYTWDSVRIHHNDITVGLSTVSGYSGADHLQTSHGTTIYENIFQYKSVNYATSVQHPDTIQTTGQFVKIYNNEFINVADSNIMLSGWSGATQIANVWIFNNLFRATAQLGQFPEFIRVVNHGGVTFYDNVKVLNNTFVDNTAGNTLFISFDPELDETAGAGGEFVGSGNEFKNNLLYNVGASNSFTLTWAIGAGTPSLWEFGGNLLYHPTPAHIRISHHGTVYSAASWIATKEPTAINAQPSFVSYTLNGASNDLRLHGNDTAATSNGVDLSALLDRIPELAYTKDGVERGGDWHIGAMSGDPTPNTTPIVSPIDVNPAAATTSIFGASITFSTEASDAQDGDLTASIVWTSNRDGTIGTGGSLTTSSLSVGAHLIGASVADSGGSGHATFVPVTILPLDPGPAYLAPHRPQTRAGLMRILAPQ